MALKVIKHCQEEGSSSELVTGILVGLVIGTTLEITNCFPLPKEWDEPGDESEKSEMMFCCLLPIIKVCVFVME